ncbi:tachylectin-related carbohydrate-binding protein [Lentzea sp. NPDC051213]|uniref:tachylectin-related carbohydrate-binding protein n=1 Tax=Lentzea sp. NPDC051213 TaxID=3364126 RepID=UPI0037BD6C00
MESLCWPRNRGSGGFALRVKLRAFCLAAVVGVGAIAGAGGAAAADVSCGAVARVFTVQADGDLWLYEHAAPGTGGFAWAGARQIGWGWGGKTFAGADGRVYNITVGGELRLLRYRGGGWDTFGGGQYRTIGWGWQKFVEAAHRGKITVDADGAIYTLEGDQLRWWRYDDVAGAWAPGSGRVLDVGWGRFDLIAASGSGGLQARDAVGALHRFRYHVASERFVAYDVVSAVDWRGGGSLFSPGGDVYYSVRPDSGELRWNRFTEGAGWQSTTGSVVGTGWGTDVDVTATTTDCSTALPGPVIEGSFGDPTGVPYAVEPASGGRYVVGTNDQHTIVSDWYDPVSLTWQRTNLAGAHTGIRPPVVDDAAGTATIGALWGGNVELITLRAGTWEAPISLRGAMSSTPALVRRADGTLAVYAIAPAGNEVGHLYVREQLSNGDFLAWRRFGDPAADYNSVTAIARGDETTVLANAYGGEPHVFRHSPGARPVAAGELRGTGLVGPLTLVQDSTGALLVFGALRNGESNMIVHVRREKADRTGFEDLWQSLGPFGTRNAWDEPVAARLLPNGTVALSVPADGKPFVTTSKGPGSTEFHPWAPVEVPQGMWFSDPTALSVSRAGEVQITAESAGNRRHLFTAPVPADPATPLRFTGGPLYPF